MAVWSKNKVESSAINGGNEYEKKDRLSREQLNAITNNAFYASDVADEAKRIAENVQAGTNSPVSYAPQILSDNQKSQARNNIGAYSQEDANKKADISQISNPNLLINGDFRVNQRGKTTYSSTGYTVDRWRSSSSSNNGSVIVTDNGITFSASGGPAYLYQDMEFGFETLKGKVVTMSVGLTDGTILYTSGTVPTEVSSSTIRIGDITHDGMDATGIYLRTNGYIRVQVGALDGYSFDISYVKVEIGNVATTFVPRPYAEELSLCQRYGFVVDGLRRIRASYVWSNNIDFAIILPSNLRTTPTMDFTNFKITTINSTLNIQTGFTFAVFGLSGNIIGIRCTKSAHGMTDAVLEVSNTFIDAEIY